MGWRASIQRFLPIANVTRHHTNAVTMKASVLQIAPLGSLVAYAIQVMHQEGFRCSMLTTQPAYELDDDAVVDTSHIQPTFDCILCMRKDGANWPFRQDWWIRLVYENDHITDVHVRTALTGP